MRIISELIVRIITVVATPFIWAGVIAIAVPLAVGAWIIESPLCNFKPFYGLRANLAANRAECKRTGCYCYDDENHSELCPRYTA